MERIMTAFANGGNQNNETIPEVSVCKELRVGLVDGLGRKYRAVAGY